MTHGAPYTLLVIPIMLGLLLGAGCSRMSSPDVGGSADSSFDEGANRPPTAQTLYVLAHILENQGRAAEAETALIHLVESYPKFAPAYNRLAMLRMEQDRIEDAMIGLQIGLEQSPDDPVLLNNLGLCHLIIGEFKEAAGFFQEAAGRNPQQPRYRSNLALAEALQGKDEEALALWSQVLIQPEAEENLDQVKHARLRIDSTASDLP